MQQQIDFPRARAIDVSYLETSLAITWQLVSKLVYQIVAYDVDEVQSFMRISHDTQDHFTLASHCIWAVFQTNKIMKEIGKVNKIKDELKELRETVKFLTAEAKAAKSQALSAITKADKALTKSEPQGPCLRLRQHYAWRVTQSWKKSYRYSVVPLW
eukprot:1920832-Ditylum_brightwellii.AAC.2